MRTAEFPSLVFKSHSFKELNNCVTFAETVSFTQGHSSQSTSNLQDSVAQNSQ